MATTPRLKRVSGLVSTLATILALATPVGPAPQARAGDWMPLLPDQDFYDFQLFAPPDLQEYEMYPEPSEGIFFSYDRLAYGDYRHRAMSALPGMRERTVLMGGFSKAYAMTGWRVGWMIGPNDVVKAATNLQSHATSNVANVSQIAALAAVSGDLAAVDEMKVAFDRRRKLIVGMLDAIPGVTCPMPEGAFYVYPSVKDLMGRTLRGATIASSSHLAGLILDEVEVAVVPGEAFGTPGYLRLSYATGDADITEGVGRIAGLLAEAQ